ncbi:MAG: mannose-6-phosphate isomerase [Anaerolineae bacterium SM23_84]|nr:MAG: mannose-6-phosphate isomerase [Anaerolineae bacterium SM23_84]
MIAIVNLQDKMNQIDRPWSPVDIARVNDQVMRMALLEGAYHWHQHTNEDELFCVLKGEIVIQVKDQPEVHLREGEMAVIPKGVEHRPTSEGPSYILMFEPFALKSRGD